MPAPRPASRLGLLAFPQRWQDGQLHLRFLCLPKGDPAADLAPGQPSFAAAGLVFEARLIAGLDRLPRAADAVALVPLALAHPPTAKAALLAELENQLHIVPPAPPDPSVPPAPAPTFQKPLAESYRARTGGRQLSSRIVSGADFECALHDAQASQPAAPAPLDDSITWSRLIALLLRQPALAEACGLLGEATVTPPAGFFAEGGWLYVDLHATSAYAAAPAGFTALYAARIPPLPDQPAGEPGIPLYAAVLFPVDGLDPADDVYREAERYAAGFARLVHGAQTDRDGGGDAIRLAWDDEQVAEWFQRQADPMADAPMGTAGYRVDVRRVGEEGWASLQRIASVGSLALGPHDLGPYAGEAAVEVVPAQIAPAYAGRYWLPAYFATWRGGSLVLTDPDLVALHQDPALAGPETPPHRLGRDKAFRPVGHQDVLLRYGTTYEFRVRLADLTSGGPVPDDPMPPAPDAIATVPFRRRTRPAAVGVLQRPDGADLQLRLAKPRLGYPDALFAGQAFADLQADALAEPGRAWSVPDPDVLAVEIQVEVRALEGDEQPWWPLFTTTRLFPPFPAGELTLTLDPQDHATLAAFPATQPAAGLLAIPTARHVRLTLTALGRDDEGYFESPDHRRGHPVTVELRAGATAEEPLFGPPADLPLRAFFFQPPPTDGSVAGPVERLAQELGLDCARLTVAGRPGRRAVFGCAAALPHTLSAERSALTFASNAEVVGRWVNVLCCTLARDWTWDGLAESGIEVRRVVKRPGLPDREELAGTLRLPHALSSGARRDVEPQVRAPRRQSTELVFFDAFDPKPEPGRFPTEIAFEYRLAPSLRALPAPGPTPPLTLEAPVTTPPAQTPRLVSAGLALSPYAAAGDYSSTEPRRRELWLEFEAPPADPDDRLFVRVLAGAPDPLLTAEEIAETPEPPLPLDPEWMRLIVPGQPRDDSGRDAMQPLTVSSDDRRHWLIPLPPGLETASPELFGFYTYEIRLGHDAARWCTAQGLYGPPLRVAGVQHPAPTLVCQAARTRQRIRVRAPFATPVHQGRNVRPRFPQTALWALLYARIRQTDAASWRNLLLARTPLHAPSPTLGTELLPEHDAAVLFGEGDFDLALVHDLLRRNGLPADAPLTTLAVELFQEPPVEDPMGTNLGFARMLRVSPLAPVPDAC